MSEIGRVEAADVAPYDPHALPIFDLARNLLADPTMLNRLRKT